MVTISPSGSAASARRTAARSVDFNRPMTLVTAADGTIPATLRAGRRYELRFA